MEVVWDKWAGLLVLYEAPIELPRHVFGSSNWGGSTSHQAQLRCKRLLPSFAAVSASLTALTARVVAGCAKDTSRAHIDIYHTPQNAHDMQKPQPSVAAASGAGVSLTASVAAGAAVGDVAGTS